MTAAYARRRIDLTVQLGQGSFGGSGFDTIKITGLRIHAHIELANTPSTGMAQIRAFGLSLDHVNQLSRAGLVYQTRANSILVEAGDDISGMTVIFNGIVIEAQPDFRNQPDVSFFILAAPTPIIQLRPVAPTAFPGSVSVSTALQTIAEKAGLTVEANGVSTILQSPYFDGAAWTQILSLVQAAGVFGFVDGIKKLIAIWPKDGSRSGNESAISPETGMIGYPSFQANTIVVRTLFSPTIKTDVGQVITVQSQLTAADGKFVVFGKTHELASELPDGPWETVLEASPRP